VIYADTDSIFVTGATKESFGSFVDWCNKVLYPSIISSLACSENDIYLAYEKAFERIVFVSAKRYAGRFAHYKGKAATIDSKPEIKGLEYKRGDTAFLARKLQEDVIMRILAGEENAFSYRATIESMRTRIAKDKLDLKLVAISKSLSRTIDGYSKGRTLPAHVRVAEILASRGETMREGSRVSYVVTDNHKTPATVIPASDFTGAFDREYLWQNLVYPPTLRLLQAAFPKQDWDKENDLLQLQPSLFAMGDAIVKPMRKRTKKGTP
jgi:DNA polymerase elongation subunit (family B)